MQSSNDQTLFEVIQSLGGDWKKNLELIPLFTKFLIDTRFCPENPEDLEKTLKMYPEHYIVFYHEGVAYYILATGDPRAIDNMTKTEKKVIFDKWSHYLIEDNREDVYQKLAKFSTSKFKTVNEWRDYVLQKCGCSSIEEFLEKGTPDKFLNDTIQNGEPLSSSQMIVNIFRWFNFTEFGSGSLVSLFNDDVWNNRNVDGKDIKGKPSGLGPHLGRSRTLCINADPATLLSIMMSVLLVTGIPFSSYDDLAYYTGDAYVLNENKKYEKIHIEKAPVLYLEVQHKALLRSETDKIKRFNNTYQALSLDNALKPNGEAIFTHHLELIRRVWEKIGHCPSVEEFDEHYSLCLPY